MTEIKLRTCVPEHGSEERVLPCPDVATWSFTEVKEKIGSLWNLEDAEDRILECSAGIFREHGTTIVCTAEQWTFLRFIIRQDGHTLKVRLIKAEKNSSASDVVAREAISNTVKIRKVAALIKKRHARCHVKRQIQTAEAVALKAINELQQVEISSLKEANESQGTELGQLQVTNQEQKEELAHLQSQLQDSTALKSSHVDQLDELTSSHVEKLGAIEFKHNAELAIIKAIHSKELAERDDKLAAQALELASLKSLRAAKGSLTQAYDAVNAASSLEPLRLLDRTAEKVDRTAEQLGTLADAHEAHLWELADVKRVLQALVEDVQDIKKDNAQFVRSVHTGESDSQHESALLVPEAGWCPELTHAQAAPASTDASPAQATNATTKSRSSASSCSSTVSAPESDWSELQRAS